MIEVADIQMLRIVPIVGLLWNHVYHPQEDDLEQQDIRDDDDRGHAPSGAMDIARVRPAKHKQDGTDEKQFSYDQCRSLHTGACGPLPLLDDHREKRSAT